MEVIKVIAVSEVGWASVSELGKTTVFVTHDQVEAITLASRLAVIDQGQIQAVDTTQIIGGLTAETVKG